jgi:hypothetical protein
VTNGYADPADGLFQDWFELFNPNTNSVSFFDQLFGGNNTRPEPPRRVR